MGKTKESRNQTKKATKTSENDLGDFPTPETRRSIDDLIKEEMRLTCCTAIKKDWESYPLLSKAIYVGCNKIVDELLERGEEVNAQTEDGNSPLMIAVDKGDIEITQKLLEQGADIKLANKNGKNPLMVAISKNDVQMFHLLWKHVDADDKSFLNQESVGATVLCLAFKQENLDIDVIRVLMSKLNAEDQDFYVQRRIELLETPKPKTCQEMVRFYKDILFRVMYQIKRIFQDGLKLLHKHKFFFRLMKCAQSHQWDTDLLRLAFHLSACIMYEDDALCKDLGEKIADQFVEAKGPHFSLRIMISKLAKEMPDVRGAAFLPIHICANCTSGRQWLTKNYIEVHQFVDDFKTLRCTMDYWVKDEDVRAAVAFQKFEIIMMEIQESAQCLKRSLILPLSSPTQPQTGYADALKKNMSFQSKALFQNQGQFLTKNENKVDDDVKTIKVVTITEDGEVEMEEVIHQPPVITLDDDEECTEYESEANISTDTEDISQRECTKLNASFEGYLDDGHENSSSRFSEIHKNKSLVTLYSGTCDVASSSFWKKRPTVTIKPEDSYNPLIAKAFYYIPLTTMFFLANRYYKNVSLNAAKRHSQSPLQMCSLVFSSDDSKNTGSSTALKKVPRLTENDNKSAEKDSGIAKVEHLASESHSENSNQQNGGKSTAMKQKGAQPKNKSKKMSVLELLERARMLSKVSQKNQGPPNKSCNQNATISQETSRNRTYSDVAKGNTQSSSESAKQNKMSFLENIRNFVTSAVGKTQTPSGTDIDENKLGSLRKTDKSCNISKENDENRAIENLSPLEKVNKIIEKDKSDCWSSSETECNQNSEMSEAPFSEQNKGEINDTDTNKDVIHDEFKSNFESSNDFNCRQWGYIPELVNIEKRSNWYHVLKNIHSCLPLSYHLMPPSEEVRTQVTFHTITMPDGKVVFSTKQEYTLREGVFGTYLGLCDYNGLPIVAREYSNSNISREEGVKALSNKCHLKHRNIVTFFGAATAGSKVFSVSELCEFNLSQFVKEVKRLIGCIPATVVTKQMVLDLLEGIKFLHKMQVIHGFLKPSNVMVTMDCRLKLADCFLLDIVPFIWGVRYCELKMEPIGTSVSSFSWRPTELIAAENECEARENIAFASDIQMAGMLMYFILSGGKHRFGKSDAECQENIKQGFHPPRLESMDYEAKDLMNGMMKKNKTDRPTIKTVTKHPYFWNSEFKFQFIIRVGKKLICESKKSDEVEEFRKYCSEIKHWTSFIYPWLITYLCKQTSKLYTNDPVDLLHFAIALHDNFEAIPSIYKQFVLRPSQFFLRVFPTFFLSVYNLVRQKISMQRQTGLQHLF